MQYNPVQKILRVYSSITMRVIEVEGESENKLAPGSIARLTPELNDAFAHRFINSQTVSSRYEYIEENGKLIVITDPIYDEVLHHLFSGK